MFYRTGNDQRVKELSQLDLFSDCTHSELRHVGALTTEVEVPAGKTLCRQGGVGTECFIVLEGEVTVERDGTELTILGPGAIIGEMALLGVHRRTANVRAITPVRLLVLHDVEFRSMLHGSPSVAEKVAAGASIRAAAWDGEGAVDHDEAAFDDLFTLPAADLVLALAESVATP
jgi:phosphoserine phosphatase RsbU/P